MKRSTHTAVKSEEDPYIGTIEAAKMLDVTAPTVQRWIDAGALRCYRTLGGHRRVLRSEVIKFRSTRAPAIPNDDLIFGRAKILLVDDEPRVLDVMKRLILRRYRNVVVETTDSGLEALLIALGRSTPNALILDIVMPKVDGLDVIRRIKKEPAHAKMVVIALSGHRDKEAEALAAGAAAFFPKGDDPAQFIDALRDHIPSLRIRKRGRAALGKGRPNARGV